MASEHGVQAAEVVLPCAELDDTLPFFTDRLGFRIESIFPADDPATVVVSGHGLRLRLQRDGAGEPGLIRLACPDPAALAAGASSLTAPNGTRIELVEAEPPLHIPPVRPKLTVSRMGGDASWGVGRAGMLYRDLLPDRQGGFVIASHIRIPDGGPVPDYVHFHQIRFQMIYCYKGWVRLVYEDQGPPFILQAGDCVLQPPEIRHRVLECGPGLEVIELGCPAEHLTCVDHDLALPTAELRPDRLFGGQRFVRHEVATANWRPWRLDGFEARDLGIGEATGGIAGVRVARRSAPAQPRSVSHGADLQFLFVLQGKLTLNADGHADEPMSTGDTCVVPRDLAHALEETSDDLELLEVTLPAAP